MSAVLDESLVANTVAVASELSLPLKLGLETDSSFNFGMTFLFGGHKASLQSCVVSALLAEIHKAALSRLGPSTQMVLSKGSEETGPVAWGISF